MNGPLMLNGAFQGHELARGSLAHQTSGLGEHGKASGLQLGLKYLFWWMVFEWEGESFAAIFWTRALMI